MSERYAPAPESFGDNVGRDAGQSIDLDTLRDFEIAYKALEQQGETVNRQDVPQNADEDLLSESLRASRELLEGGESITAQFGPGYQDVVDLIEASIKLPREGRYAAIQVPVGKTKIPLGEYLAADIYKLQGEGMLTPEGRKKIFAEYIKIADPNNASSRPDTGPVVTVWESPSGKHFRDLESLKAGDSIDD